MALLNPKIAGLTILDHRSITPCNPSKTILLRDATTEGAIRKVIFHCTDANDWSPERLAKFFVDERGFPICAYHYYVREEAVYQMIGENIVGYHSACYNKESLGFSIDYHATMAERLNIDPHPLVMANAELIAAMLCVKHKVDPVKGKLNGHRELFGTGFIKDKNDLPKLRKTCPGLRINLDNFRQKVRRIIQEHLKSTSCPEIVVDGIWGPASALALRLHHE